MALAGCGATSAVQGLVQSHTNCLDYNFEFSNLRWSHDGSRIAYSVVEPYGPSMPVNTAIHTLDPATMTDTQVYSGRSGYSALAWSPDDRALFLAAGVRKQWYVLSLDRSPTKLAAVNIPYPVAVVDWSPDGRTILIVSGKTATGYLKIKALDVSDLPEILSGTALTSAGDIHDLSSTTLAGTDARWSPDGKQIAYIPEGMDAINIINADGTGDRSLSKRIPGYVEYLGWSPDGRYIIYSNNGSHLTPDTHIVEIGTGQDRTAIPKGYSPDWSPDGKQIAYVGPDQNLVPQIYVMDVSGGNVRQLTHKAAQNICLH